MIVSASNHRILVVARKEMATRTSPSIHFYTLLTQRKRSGKQLASLQRQIKGEGSRERTGGSIVMDCCICSPLASVYRLPRNTICAPCHEGAKAIIAFLHNDEHQDDDDDHASVTSRGSTKPNRSPNKASVCLLLSDAACLNCMLPIHSSL
jgi:hypothetical protein